MPMTMGRQKEHSPSHGSPSVSPDFRSFCVNDVLAEVGEQRQVS